MLWAAIDISSTEGPIREDLARIFHRYIAVSRAITEHPYGLAASSHLANRIRLHGDGKHSFDRNKLEEEFTKSLDVLSAFGVIESQTCYSPGFDGFSSVPFLLTGNSSVSSQTVLDIERAKDLISKTCYSYICKRLENIAIITLCRQHFPDTNQSYTIQSVLHTVYIDTYEHPILTAESLVHEHAHLTLNNYVNHRRLQFDPTPRYYSPWKETKRPLFNFLHSLIAFSEVINFLAELSPLNFDDNGRKYLEMKLKYELQNINSVKSTAATALRETTDRQIAQTIECALDRMERLT